MPRPLLVRRPVKVTFNIPEDTIARVKLELFSELEDRVPHGELSALVARLLEQWLEGRGAVRHD